MCVYIYILIFIQQRGGISMLQAGILLGSTKGLMPRGRCWSRQVPVRGVVAAVASPALHKPLWSQGAAFLRAALGRQTQGALSCGGHKGSEHSSGCTSGRALKIPRPCAFGCIPRYNRLGFSCSAGSFRGFGNGKPRPRGMHGDGKGRRVLGGFSCNGLDWKGL